MSTWTIEQKLTYLLGLPWTVTSVPADDLDDLVVEVVELPETIVVASEADIDVEYWHALAVSIRVRLECGDPIPHPPTVKAFPWEGTPAEDTNVADEVPARLQGLIERTR